MNARVIPPAPSAPDIRKLQRYIADLQGEALANEDVARIVAKLVRAVEIARASQMAMA